MAFFNTFNESYSDYEVDLSSKYAGDNGFYHLMTETFDFEEEITLEMLKADYKELTAVKEEGASYEYIEYIQEASIKEVANKIKEFFVKFGIKIKEFVHGWIVRIKARFVKDNLAFYNKYKEQAEGKEEMKLKYRQIKENWFVERFSSLVIESLRKSYGIDHITSDAEIKVKDEEIDKDKFLDDAVKTINANFEFSKLKEKVRDNAYLTKEATEVTYGEIKDEVIELLTKNTLLDQIQKAADANGNVCKAEAKDAEKVEGSKIANRYSMVVSAYAKITNRYLDTSLNIQKAQLSQARSAFAKAVQYKSKK